MDILHGDFNMASSLGYVSTVFDDLVYIHPNDQDILWGMPRQIDADTPGDCCGLVLRRTHWMVDALVSKHGTWDFDYAEVLGIGPADTNSHWMNFIHFQTSAHDRAGLRGAQRKQHRAERAKTKACASGSANGLHSPSPRQWPARPARPGPQLSTNTLWNSISLVLVILGTAFRLSSNTAWEHQTTLFLYFEVPGWLTLLLA